MPFDAVGLGLCAWDSVCLFERYPGPNQKVEVISSTASGGGPVPTALTIFSRLGGKGAYLGVVGDDAEGEKVRRDLENFGVDVSHMIVRPHRRTPCAYIWVDRRSGDRTVALDPGDAENMRTDELPETLLKEASLLLIDGRQAELCLTAARMSRQGGAKVILDAGSPRQRIEELLSVADHAVVSSDFVQGTFPGLRSEAAMQKISSLGPPAVVVTEGRKGGCWREGPEQGCYPAFNVEVVDTTGAGDAFHGAYLYALIQGWDMSRRCHFASAVAALVCRALGGRAAAPTLEEAMAFLNMLDSS